MSLLAVNFAVIIKSVDKLSSSVEFRNAVFQMHIASGVLGSLISAFLDRFACSRRIQRRVAARGMECRMHGCEFWVESNCRWADVKRGYRHRGCQWLVSPVNCQALTEAGAVCWKIASWPQHESCDDTSVLPISISVKTWVWSSTWRKVDRLKHCRQCLAGNRFV